MRTDKDKAEERARDAGRPLFAMKRPQDGLPEDIRDHIRLMCDIIAIWFKTDKTRVASLLSARDKIHPRAARYPEKRALGTYNTTRTSPSRRVTRSRSRYSSSGMAYLRDTPVQSLNSGTEKRTPLRAASVCRNCRMAVW